MDLVVVVEQDAPGLYVASVPVLPGCHAWGRSRGEALADVRAAIAAYLEENGPPEPGLVAVERVRVGTRQEGVGEVTVGV